MPRRGRDEGSASDRASPTPLVGITIGLVLLAVPLMQGVAGLTGPASLRTTVADAHLPDGIYNAAAVWVPSQAAAYVFGGDGHSPTDRILRYDPAGDTLETMHATLPRNMSLMGAVVSDEEGAVYLFGGSSPSAYTMATILRYDPATDTLEEMDETLPYPLRAPAAVWDDRRDIAYILGGEDDERDGVCLDGETRCDRILAYDPSRDEIEVTDVRLPAPRSHAAAVWDPAEEVAYIVGGAGWGCPPPDVSILCNDVLRFDPSQDEVAPTTATLPTPRCCMAAVHDDATGLAYLFGGTTDVDLACGSSTGECREILVLDPLAGTVTREVEELPGPRHGPAAAWDPGAGQAFVFGGSRAVNPSDEIVRYTPVVSPSLPEALAS